MAGLADVSAMALMKRLKKSKDWLHALCVELFREQGHRGGLQRRFPGPGVRRDDGQGARQDGFAVAVALQRLPAFPDLRFLPAHGNEGARRRRVPVALPHPRRATTCSPTAGTRPPRASTTWRRAGGHVIVRVNTGSLVLRSTGGAPFDLLAAVTSLERAGAVESWPGVAVEEAVAVPGRVCAVRKTQQASRLAQRKLRKEAARKGKQV